MSTVWLATGNNVALAGDICRRTIHVRIISEDEHPEHRSNFKHPNLISWLAENRGQFLADALTVLSGFLRSGATIKPTTAFGSYEGWSSVVRSAILWLDLPDPCLSQVGLAENSDSDTQILAQLLDAWEAYAVRHSLNHGALIPEILHGLYPNLPKDQWSNGPEDSALRASLEAITRSKPRQTPSAEEVGNRFRRFKGRFFGGKCLNHIGKRTNRGFVWGVINKKNPLFPTNNNGHSVTGAGSVASLFPTREKTQREGEFGGDQRSTPAPHTQPAQTFASDGAGGYAGEPDEVSEMSGGR